MKNLWLINFIIPIFCACHADPGVLEDDDITSPNGSNEPVVCDTLLAPNSVFSDAIGDRLVFADSVGFAYDTLVCNYNFAIEQLAESNEKEYCQKHKSSGYSTKWLPEPEVYELYFDYLEDDWFVKLSGHSVQVSDFHAFRFEFTDFTGISENIKTINGKRFSHTFSYVCTENYSCTFVEEFVFSLNYGLIAFKRNNQWWTRI